MELPSAEPREDAESPRPRSEIGATSALLSLRRVDSRVAFLDDDDEPVAERREEEERDAASLRHAAPLPATGSEVGMSMGESPRSMISLPGEPSDDTVAGDLAADALPSFFFLVFCFLALEPLDFGWPLVLPFVLPFVLPLALLVAAEAVLLLLLFRAFRVDLVAGFSGAVCFGCCAWLGLVAVVSDRVRVAIGR